MVTEHLVQRRGQLSPADNYVEYVVPHLITDAAAIETRGSRRGTIMRLMRHAFEAGREYERAKATAR